MSKKLVVKLLATVMAMTMVVGSELTVFAAEPDLFGIIHKDGCTSYNTYNVSVTAGTLNSEQHEVMCRECGEKNSEFDCGAITITVKKDMYEHYIKCWCCDKIIDTVAHEPDPTSSSWGEPDGHTTGFCAKCVSGIGDLQPHTYELCYFTLDGVPKHSYKCTVCGYDKEGTLGDHDTNGENGTCSVCGFDPNFVCGGSSSSKEEKDEKIKETSSSSSKKEKDEKIKETSSSSSTPKVDIVEEINKALAKQLEETIKAEESIPVTSFASTTAVNAVPAEVKATATAGATYNLSQITTTQGFVAAVNKIAEANLGATSVTVYSSNPMAFSEDVLTAVANANKEFVYTFNHKGHLYKITIPAGAKIDLNGNRYAGPLYIGAQLGTSVVLK